MDFLIGVLFLLTVWWSVVGVTEGRLSVDFSLVTEPAHQKQLRDFGLETMFAVPSTTTFTLVMNHRARRGMAHLIEGESQKSQQQQQQQHQKPQHQEKQQEQQLQQQKQQQQQPQQHIQPILTQQEKQEQEQQQEQQKQQHQQQHQHEQQQQENQEQQKQKQLQQQHSQPLIEQQQQQESESLLDQQEQEQPQPPPQQKQQELQPLLDQQQQQQQQQPQQESQPLQDEQEQQHQQQQQPQPPPPPQQQVNQEEQHTQTPEQIHPMHTNQQLEEHKQKVLKQLHLKQQEQLLLQQQQQQQQLEQRRLWQQQIQQQLQAQQQLQQQQQQQYSGQKVQQIQQFHQTQIQQSQQQQQSQVRQSQPLYQRLQLQKSQPRIQLSQQEIHQQSQLQYSQQLLQQPQPSLQPLQPKQQQQSLPQQQQQQPQLSLQQLQPKQHQQQQYLPQQQQQQPQSSLQQLQPKQQQQQQQQQSLPQQQPQSSLQQFQPKQQQQQSLPQQQQPQSSLQQLQPKKQQQQQQQQQSLPQQQWQSNPQHPLQSQEPNHSQIQQKQEPLQHIIPHHQMQQQHKIQSESHPHQLNQNKQDELQDPHLNERREKSFVVRSQMAVVTSLVNSTASPKIAPTQRTAPEDWKNSQDAKPSQVRAPTAKRHGLSQTLASNPNISSSTFFNSNISSNTASNPNGSSFSILNSSISSLVPLNPSISSPIISNPSTANPVTSNLNIAPFPTASNPDTSYYLDRGTVSSSGMNRGTLFRGTLSKAALKVSDANIDKAMADLIRSKVAKNSSTITTDKEEPATTNTQMVDTKDDDVYAILSEKTKFTTADLREVLSTVVASAGLSDGVAGLSAEDLVELLSESGGQDLSLVPSDHDFEDIMRLMRLLRTHSWRPDAQPSPKVQELETIRVPAEVEHHLQELTQKTTTRGPEEGRANHNTNPITNTDRPTPRPISVDPDRLEHMLTSVFSVTRTHDSDNLGLESAALYITRKFESYGLMVMEHVFSGAEFQLWFGQNMVGTNIVGILPGHRWGTPGDEPLIIGAHLDTVSTTPGLDDNGSGLAALVESCRVVAGSGCVLENSVIFVAFDLEEIGTQGSLMFVKDYLARTIIHQFHLKRVTGAFILDCVANWTPDPYTQDFAPAWYDLLPYTADSLTRRNFTGDFAAIIYRSTVDAHLAHSLAGYYGALGEDQYRLELLGLTQLGDTMPSIDSLQTHIDLLRSDHLRFWYHNDSTLDLPTIPAVLVTDMGPYRGGMRRCYHNYCDGPTLDGIADVGFLTKVTQGLVWAVLDLAGGRCGPKGALSPQTVFTLSAAHRGNREGMVMSSMKQVLAVLQFLGLLPTTLPTHTDML